MSKKKPDTSPAGVAQAGEGTHANETTIVVREIMPGSIRTQGGRKQRLPYTSIHINDYLNGKLVACHYVTINAAAHVAIGIVQTICRRNLDLSKKQLEQAKSPEGVTL